MQVLDHACMPCMHQGLARAPGRPRVGRSAALSSSQQLSAALSSSQQLSAALSSSQQLSAALSSSSCLTGCAAGKLRYTVSTSVHPQYSLLLTAACSSGGYRGVQQDAMAAPTCRSTAMTTMTQKKTWNRRSSSVYGPLPSSSLERHARPSQQQQQHL
jgi:hypothetical protein